MAIVFVGIDLAKNVFAVHGVNPAGKPERVRPSVPRAKLHEMIAALPPVNTEEYTDQGQAYYEERYRERVLRQPSQRANKLGIQLVAVSQPV
jgi:hypothetical protein